jgi:hypothetical protein
VILSNLLFALTFLPGATLCLKKSHSSSFCSAVSLVFFLFFFFSFFVIFPSEGKTFGSEVLGLFFLSLLA